ncbi:FHA domain-containing protein [Actinomycetospora lemnae]|uniref:FHA domain-containing protein n=1 Tax=Actinomycetospora lemnae TaxID=3019891 RepID=A0ABT5SZ21_9PSEU|nr:FHA domain-containing protein [Actinomycetospora sp. DW7H6]MDD7966963.1 FHA domain-containing protein [Actinomycetospora sp. DW7H6]
MADDRDRATSFLEVWRPGGVEVVLLSPPTVTIGRGEGNGVVLDHDGQVSSLHAVLQAYGPSWAIRDLGSTNGTVVGGERLIAERALRHGDVIHVGATRMVFRGSGGRAAPTTAPRRAPELTRREHDVLVALCRPLFSGAVFTEPATARAIAAELVVSEAAVKQHLLRLYDKFELDPTSTRRRVELANAALERGAVTPGELT